MNYMLKSSDAMTRASAQYFIDVFGKWSNIEDLISKIQSRTDELKNAVTEEDKREYFRQGNHRGHINTSLQSWFNEIRIKTATAYAEFATSIVQSGDVLITFNYDDSLDRELKRAGKWDISQGYGFQLGDIQHSSDVLLLKLHGSINWLVSLFGGATGGTLIVNPSSSMGNHPVVHENDLKFLGYENFTGHTYKSGGAFPCLILPGRSKEFFYDTSMGHEFVEFWDHLWSQASEAVRHCDRIVICGYNLLPVDQRACDLILKKPSKTTSIEIICGEQSDRIANDFKNAGFKNVQVFGGKYFSEWVKLRSVIGRQKSQNQII